MNDWLVNLSKKPLTDDEELGQAISRLSEDDRHAFFADIGAEERESRVDDFGAKLDWADAAGRELAQANSQDMSSGGTEKVAFIPALVGMAGRALGGSALKSGVGSLAKNLVKDQIVGAGVSAVGKGLNRARQGVRPPMAPAPIMSKVAYTALDQVAGGVIGYNRGRAQKERGEPYSFGGRQVASFLVPGGVGYQIGRTIAHDRGSPKEKTAMFGAIRGAAAGLRGAASSFTSGGVPGMASRFSKTMMQDPRKAMTIGGAALGAAQGLVRDPGYDEYGRRRSRIGAAAMGGIGGGAIGYGVGSIPGAQRGVRGMGKGLNQVIPQAETKLASLSLVERIKAVVGR